MRKAPICCTWWPIVHLLCIYTKSHFSFCSDHRYIIDFFRGWALAKLLGKQPFSKYVIGAYDRLITYK